MAKGIDIKKLVKPSVRGLKAYEAKEIPCRVKLDANESPYGFEVPRVKISTNRYPDPEALRLHKALGRTMGVPGSQVLTGNGSDELIYYLINTFGGPVLFPTPTFVMYGIIATSLGEQAVGVPLDSDFDIDERAMNAAIRKHKPKLIFLSTPNNPTGNCFSSDRVLRIVGRSKGIVVVDEAYQPFASARGYAPLLADYPNMVIMRTLSKIGLAALRVGYMAASEDIVGEVNKVRLPYNLNTLSQEAALAALKGARVMKANIAAIVKERARMVKALEGMEGVEPCPTEANFIMFRVADSDAVHAGLLKRGVLIKNLGGLIKGAMRVTVGSPRENTAFLKALKETIAK